MTPVPILMIRIISFLIFATFSLSAAAQQPDSIQVDTTMSVQSVDSSSQSTSTNTGSKKRGFLGGFFRKDYPNPKKAALLSIILPGAGQIYNKKLLYVRLPIIYGGLGFMGYLIGYNTQQTRELSQAYLYRVDGIDTTTSDPKFDVYSSNDLKRLRDNARKNKELSYIGFFVVYTLQAVEAFVAAHLLTFDVTDDLSMQVQPSLQYVPLSTPTMGIGLQFKFHQSSPPTLPVFLITP